MAQPIRWDNIQGANLSEASRPLEAAARTLDLGLGRIQDTLTAQRALEDTNAATMRTNNTNAFLDAVAKFRTPEELRAAQASGAIDQLRSQYGMQIDPNAARGAADARIAALQGQAQQEMAYKHMMTDERVAPLMDQFKRATLAGDKMAAAAAQSQYEQLGGRDLAGLATYADTREQMVKERGRGDIRFGNEQTKFSDDLLTSGAQRAHMASQDKAALANVAINSRNADANIRAIDFNIQNTKDQNEAARLAGRAAAAKNALKEAGNLYAEGKYDGSQAPVLLEEMTKAGIGDTPYERQAIIDRLNKMADKGVQITGPDGKTKTSVPISMSAARAAILGSKDQMFNKWNQGWANTMEDNLTNIMGTTMTDSQGNLRSRAADDLSAFNQTLRNALENAPGIRPQNQPKPKK